MKVKIKSLVKGIDPIQYAKAGDAGIDLRASGVFISDLDGANEEIIAEEYIIKSGERALVKTGLIMELPPGHWGNIRDRSGLAYKHGIHCLAGVLDETYRGEIGLVIVNLGKNDYTIKKNERIAQIIIAPYITAEIEYVDELSETERGAGGFGSTGKA